MNFWRGDQLNWWLAWCKAWLKSHHEYWIRDANRRFINVSRTCRVVDDPLVMAAQALSGIAKDLNKMSAKVPLKRCYQMMHKGRYING